MATRARARLPEGRGRTPSGPVPYATQGLSWTRRAVVEPEAAGRSAFQRDRDRIVHSTAFRRLMHKTQVFVAFEGDHYRTRLTHSIEVAQIARSLARRLGLDEDLTEALALAHDLGHTPFGHAGEEALHHCMTPFGGFAHNAQTLRILTRLEQRYARFDGLNLTTATLDGLLKHNGPLGPREAWPFGVAELVDGLGVDPTLFSSLEAQIAALADDIAYDTHDIDDGLRAGLFAVEPLLDLPLVGEMFRAVMDAHPGLEEKRLVHEALRRLISRMVDDLLEETGRRLADAGPKSADDVARAGQPLIAFGAEVASADMALKAFLRANMYRHHTVNRMTTKAKRVVIELFELYLGHPEVLPPEILGARLDGDEIETPRAIADFIAGMTDRFALAEHRRLFDPEMRI